MSRDAEPLGSQLHDPRDLWTHSSGSRGEQFYEYRLQMWDRPHGMRHVCLDFGGLGVRPARGDFSAHPQDDLAPRNDAEQEVLVDFWSLVSLLHGEINIVVGICWLI